MMKPAVTVLFLFLVLNSSQANTKVEEQVPVSHKPFELKIQTRTKSVLARAVPRAQRRLLVTNDLTDGDDRPPGPDELDLQGLYRRPEVSKTPKLDDELSDYVCVRLAVARAKVMSKYREIWT